MKVLEIIYQISLLIGIKLIVQSALSLTGMIYQYLIAKHFPNDLRQRYYSKKPYALITGASDGIGLAFCKVLAHNHNFNLIMVSRSRDKL